jgi:hypothetical protein
MLSLVLRSLIDSGSSGSKRGRESFQVPNNIECVRRAIGGHVEGDANGKSIVLKCPVQMTIPGCDRRISAQRLLNSWCGFGLMPPEEAR